MESDACNILGGIVIGAVGGAAASLVIMILQAIRARYLERTDKCRIYNWILTNTTDEIGNRYRSTRTIASYNNLTEDRVRYICSHHEQIYLSTGEREDLWAVYGIGDRKQK